MASYVDEDEKLEYYVKGEIDEPKQFEESVLNLDEDDALDIDADEVDGYAQTEEPTWPPSAAELWEVDHPDATMRFKDLSKEERRPYQMKSRKLKKEFRMRCIAYAEEHPGWQAPSKRPKRNSSRTPKRKKRARRDDDRRSDRRTDDHRENDQISQEEVVGHDEPEVIEEEIEEAPLSIYDQHLKVLKPRKRKRVTGDEEIGDIESLRALTAEMQEAAAKDWARSEEKKPVVHTVKMVDRVVSELKKSNLVRSYMDADLLEGLRDWIIPYPSGDLPPMHIRSRIYKALRNLQLHRLDDIRSFFERSEQRAQDAAAQGADKRRCVGFAKAVMQLARNPKEKTSYRKLLITMIQLWCRPLVEAQVNFQDALSRKPDERFRKARKAVRKQKRYNPIPDSKRTRARVPEKPFFDFRTMPSIKDIPEGSVSQNTNDKQKNIQKRLQSLIGGKTTKQAFSVSVSGKFQRKRL